MGHGEGRKRLLLFVSLGSLDAGRDGKMSSVVALRLADI